MPLDVNTVVSSLLAIAAVIEGWSIRQIVQMIIFQENAKNRLNDLEEEVFTNG